MGSELDIATLFSLDVAAEETLPWMDPRTRKAIEYGELNTKPGNWTREERELRRVILRWINPLARANRIPECTPLAQLAKAEADIAAAKGEAEIIARASQSAVSPLIRSADNLFNGVASNLRSVGNQLGPYGRPIALGTAAIALVGGGVTWLASGDGEPKKSGNTLPDTSKIPHPTTDLHTKPSKALQTPTTTISHTDPTQQTTAEDHIIERKNSSSGPSTFTATDSPPPLQHLLNRTAKISTLVRITPSSAAIRCTPWCALPIKKQRWTQLWRPSKTLLATRLSRESMRMQPTSAS